MKRLKISREGIVLIKSFEGFRPRAVRREDGGWVIGYGHTLSAREGASVSEADGELLLQYDLLPVVQAVNEGVEGRVNQHQFDALASFVFSVGVDRFQSSDVLERIRAGFSAEAADAMVGWPEPALPEAALRRRAAERALFVADPASPVALADLLAAPLPPPPLPATPVIGGDVAAASTPETQVVDAGAAGDASPIEAPTTGVSPESEVVGVSDARSAALAHLLDTPVARLDALEVAVPEADAVAARSTADDVTSEPDGAPPIEPVAARLIFSEAGSTSPGLAEGPAVAEPQPLPEPAEPAILPIVFPSLSAHRYSPYAEATVGPLPPMSSAPLAEPQPDDQIALDESEPQPPVDPSAPADLGVEAAPRSDLPSVLPATELQGVVDPLVLTPMAEGAFTSTPRLVWPEDSRGGGDVHQSPLFDEDAVLHRTLGPVVRPEMTENASGRFSWGETGAYLVMGGFGLVSFGMGMAAFRLASQQSSGSNETAMMGGVLTLIAIACVGVSTYNLYRRWGRSDED